MKNTKLELASLVARQMQMIKPELDVNRTTKILAKGMTVRELEILVKNR